MTGVIMAKLFALEEQAATADEPVDKMDLAQANNDTLESEIDVTMEQIDVGFESIEKLLRARDLISRCDKNQYTNEALGLLLENIGNNLGFTYAQTQVSVESLGKKEELTLEGITDTVGIIVKRVIDFIAFLYDKVEQLWNHTVRGLNGIKREVSNIRSTAESVKGTPRKGSFGSKRVMETFQTDNGHPVTAKDVLEILKNHCDVATSTKEFRAVLNDLAEHDIDRVNQVYHKARSGEKISKDDVFRVGIEKMRRFINLASRNNRLLLGEGRSIMLEVDTEAMDSYAFQRATVQMTMTKNMNAYQADSVVTADKRQAVEIAKTLEQLSLQMSGMCDTYMHFTHSYSREIKNLITSQLTALLGLLVGPLGLPLHVISIVTYFKALYYSIVNVIKFFATKFSNVTFRTMSAGILYIKESA